MSSSNKHGALQRLEGGLRPLHFVIFLGCISTATCPIDTQPEAEPPLPWPLRSSLANQATRRTRNTWSSSFLVEHRLYPCHNRAPGREHHAPNQPPIACYVSSHPCSAPLGHSRKTCCRFSHLFVRLSYPAGSALPSPLSD